MYGSAEWRARGPLRPDEIVSVVLGTAGHIDHGKTSLVRALTGVDADRLKEEQDRGMTIDLGFAPLVLPDGRTLGIVDVPGHERFVKNMVAGATGIDLVLLVVAADDGVMPQTREHLEILTLLGLRRGLVAITKVDRPGVAPDLLAALDLELDQLLAGTFFEGAPRLRVSSVTGEGVDALRAAIAAAVAGLGPRPQAGPFRMPVQRVFSSRGFGTVLTGIPVSGALEPGDEVVVHTAAGAVLPTRIRGLQAYGRPVDRVRAGHSSALNVVDVERGAVERGDVVASPGVFRAGDLWEVRLNALGPSRLPLRTRSTVRVHLGTAEVMGEVVLLDTDEITRGQTALAQLRLHGPIVAVAGDRFVLRRHSPVEVVGGGVVLARSRWRLKARRPGVLEQLRRREAALGRLDDEVLLELEASQQDDPVATADLAVSLGRARNDVEGALALLAADGRVVAVAGRGHLTPAAAKRRDDAVAAASSQVLAALEALHAAHPARAGFPLADLRRALEGVVERDVAAALDVLARDARVALVPGAGPSRYALEGRPTELPPRERAVCAALLALLREQPLHAPPREQIEAQVLQVAGERHVAADVLDWLVAAGEVVDLGDGLLVLRAAYEQAVAAVRARLARAPATVSDLKVEMGASRRHAIAVLERLDRLEVTRREGDLRVLGQGTG
jgi:selenocysteine-specific elongation factor